MPANFNDLQTLKANNDVPGADIAKSIQAGQELAIKRQQLQLAREKQKELQNLLTYKKLRSVVGLLQQAAKEKDLSNRKTIIETASTLAEQYGFTEVADLAHKNLMFAARDLERYRNWIGPIAQGIDSGDPKQISEQANRLAVINSNPADFIKQYSMLRSIEARKAALQMRNDLAAKRMEGQAVAKLEASNANFVKAYRQAQNDLKLLGEDPTKVKLFQMREAALGLSTLITGGATVPVSREAGLTFQSYSNSVGQILDKIRGANEETASPEFVKDLQKSIQRILVNTIATQRAAYNRAAMNYSGNYITPQKAEKLIDNNNRFNDLVLKNTFRAQVKNAETMDRAEKALRIYAERLNKDRKPEEQINADDVVRQGLLKNFSPNDLHYRDAVREVHKASDLWPKDDAPDFDDPKNPYAVPGETQGAAESTPLSPQEAEDAQDDAEMKDFEEPDAELEE